MNSVELEQDGQGYMSFWDAEALGSKNAYPEDSDDCVFEATAKRICLEQEQQHRVEENLKLAFELQQTEGRGQTPPSICCDEKSLLQPVSLQLEERIQNPYPFFFYLDHSTEPDLDPDTPLTPPGRVPNFPSKMHAILRQPELSHIITWLPHGRSWRVMKQLEFELHVIPSYFEHTKFSSFLRQANGWGFRRITQGRDRGSYYHPLFLRGLFHLCKKMKRPGLSEKQTCDSDFEPDFYKISELHPLPEYTRDDLLQGSFDGDSEEPAPTPNSEADPKILKRKSSAFKFMSARPTPSTLVDVESSRTKGTPFSTPFSVVDITAPIAEVQSDLGEHEEQSTGGRDDIKTRDFEFPGSHWQPSPEAFALQSGSGGTQFAAGFAFAMALNQYRYQAMMAAAVSSSQNGQKGKKSE